MFNVYKSVSTFLGFCCVILGSVGGLGHVGAGLRCDAGFYCVSFTLSLLVIL